MKKNLLILTALLITATAFAQQQVANGDFENWYLHKPEYDFYAPEDWVTGSFCATIQDDEKCTFSIERVTDSYSGDYAIAHFTAEGSTGANYGTFSNIDDNWSSPAFSGEPESVSFSYKYNTDDNQEMEIKFYLYTGELTSMDTVAYGSYSFSTTQSEYEQVNVDLNYYSEEAPTNVFIQFDYPTTPTTGYDTLILDEIVFNYSLGINKNKKSEEFSAFATPENVKTSLPIANYSLINMNGNEVIRGKSETSSIPASSLNPGLYILKGTVNGRFVTHKVVIR